MKVRCNIVLLSLKQELMKVGLVVFSLILMEIKSLKQLMELIIVVIMIR
jgi:hypothetical protein